MPRGGASFIPITLDLHQVLPDEISAAALCNSLQDLSRLTRETCLEQNKKLAKHAYLLD